MNLRVLVIVVIYYSTILSCSKENHCIASDDVICNEQTVDFGEINLNEESKKYMVYDGIKKIVFKSQSGEMIKFEPTRERRISFINKEFELNCNDGSLNHYMYIQEQHSAPYFCEELDLGLRMNLYTYNSKLSPVFADKFQVTLYKPSTNGIIGTVIKVELIVDNRGYEKIHENSFECNVEIEYDQKVNILGHEYENVYSNKQDEARILTELYYNNVFGIVGFKDLDGILWRFDNFE